MTQHTRERTAATPTLAPPVSRGELVPLPADAPRWQLVERAIRQVRQAERILPEAIALTIAVAIWQLWPAPMVAPMVTPAPAVQTLTAPATTSPANPLPTFDYTYVPPGVYDRQPDPVAFAGDTGCLGQGCGDIWWPEWVEQVKRWEAEAAAEKEPTS